VAKYRLKTDRRELLLAAGVEAFSKASYEDVSTERIAERAGVAQGLLFHYFGTKREFFLEVVRRVIDEQEARLNANANGDPGRWLTQDVDTFLTGLIEHPPAYSNAGYNFAALIDEQQEKAVARLIARMGITEPRPLLYMAVRGWVSFALAAGNKWLSTPGVSRPEITQLLIGAFNATLAQVAASDPEAVDATFFLPATAPKSARQRADLA
jgi:AcrR family transcriptional regulator